MLGSSTQGLSPINRRLLYRTCVLPIATYGFRLWYTTKGAAKSHLNIFNRMQHKAAIWITGAFRTSPSLGVEAIAGLVPFHIMLGRLLQRSMVRVCSLSPTHPTRSLLSPSHQASAPTHWSNVQNLTPAQLAKAGGSIIKTHHALLLLEYRGVPFSAKAAPGSWLEENFPSRIH